jgi:flavin reductase (DIM6/NTAB) family NADH-FMN oxidoreductase RutF
VTKRRHRALTPELLKLLSQSDLKSRLDRALPLVTVDAAGRPHPMLCSYLELLAVDRRTIRVVIAAGSGSARNLEERGVATLLIVEPERVVYVKCRAAGAPAINAALARFDLRVEEVLEDAADPSEGHVRITGGMTYGPTPSLGDPRVQAIRAALRRERKRGSATPRANLRPP